MLNFVAFKYFIAYLLAFVPDHQDTEYKWISSTIMEPENPTRMKPVRIYSPYSVISANVVSNSSHVVLQVRFPEGVQLCQAFQLLAPTMACAQQDLLSLEDFSRNFDSQIIYRSFNIMHTPGNMNNTIYSVLVSNHYNIKDIDNMFPSWIANMTRPLLFRANCNDCATEQDWGQFIADGTIGTAVDFGLFYGGKYTLHSYKQFWKGFLEAAFGPGVSVGSAMAAPGAAASVDTLATAAMAELGAESALLNVIPTAAVEAAVTSSAASSPRSFRSVISGTASSIKSASSQGASMFGSMSGAAFREYLNTPRVVQVRSTPIGSQLEPAIVSAISSASTSSMHALAQGARITTRQLANRILAATTRAMLHGPMRRRREVDSDDYTDSDVEAPIVSKYGKNTVAGSNVDNTEATGNGTTNTSANFSNTQATVKLPHTDLYERRKQQGLFAIKLRNKRGVVGRILSPLIRLGSRIPSYAYPVAGSAIEWSISASNNLVIQGSERHTFFPIVPMVKSERYISTLLSILINTCIGETIDLPLNGYAHKDIKYSSNGKVYSQRNLLFNLNTMRAGPILHRCHPVFKTKFSGVSADRIRDALATMFDVSVEMDGYIFYSGYPPYIAMHQTILEDLISAVGPQIWHYTPRARSKREAVNNEENAERVSYTTSLTGREYPTLSWSGSADLVYTIAHLLNIPSVYGEFERMQAFHYNNSLDYYRTAASLYNSPDFIPAPTSRRLPTNFIFPLVDVLRSINPYDVSMPRMNIIREFISGFLPEKHAACISAAAQRMDLRLEHANLYVIIASFWSCAYPDDIEGIDAILSRNITSDDFEQVLLSLYVKKYSRIPILLVIDNKRRAEHFQKNFITHVRTTDSPDTWKYYSPIVITTSTDFIMSSAYSVCISRRPKRSGTGAGRLYGIRGQGSRSHQSFLAGCTNARLHLTYTSSVVEVMAHPLMPNRINSLLSVSTSHDLAVLDSSDAYDPVLSDILKVQNLDEKIEPVLNCTKSKNEPCQKQRVRRQTDQLLPQPSPIDQLTFEKMVETCPNETLVDVLYVENNVDDTVLFSGWVESRLLPLERKCASKKKKRRSLWSLLVCGMIGFCVVVSTGILVMTLVCRKRRLLPPLPETIPMK